MALVGSILLVVSPLLSWANANVQTGFGNVTVYSVAGIRNGRGVLTLLGGLACVVLWIIARTRGTSVSNRGLAIAVCATSGVVFIALVSAATDVGRLSTVAEALSGGAVNATAGPGLVLGFLADLTLIAVSVLAIVRETRRQMVTHGPYPSAPSAPNYGPGAHPMPPAPTYAPGAARPMPAAPTATAPAAWAQTQHFGPAATRPATSVSAGWYPDPSGPSRLRWWDGTQWAGA